MPMPDISCEFRLLIRSLFLDSSRIFVLHEVPVDFVCLILPLVMRVAEMTAYSKKEPPEMNGDLSLRGNRSTNLIVSSVSFDLQA
jgi:hypothetical protein